MSKQTHFNRLCKILDIERQGVRKPNPYEWFGVVNFSEDYDAIEQIAEEIQRELQQNYVSPSNPKSRQKPDDEIAIARILQSETHRRKRVLMNPNLKDYYDKLLRKELLEDLIECHRLEAISRANNPNSWPPEPKPPQLSSSNSEEIETEEEVSDDSIEAPPIVMPQEMFGAPSDSDVPDIPPVKIKPSSTTNTKERRQTSPGRASTNQARRRQKKREQRQKLSLFLLGAASGILIGFLILKAFHLL